MVLLGGARLIACKLYSASTDISSWETPDKSIVKVFEHSCAALHQRQNPFGMGTAFTELSYLFVLGAQILLSQSYLSESPNLYCSPPADYNYICIYDIQI